MNTVPTTETPIKDQIYASVINGDIRRLKSLAESFPESIEDLRYEDLVDLAFQNQHYDIVIYLILQHRFEVSGSFESDKKDRVDEESMGWNEFHQTLEVLASAALNRAPSAQRNLACYELRNWAYDLKKLVVEDTETKTIPTDTDLNPEFIRLASSGALREFLIHPKDFNFLRAEAHSVKMREALTDHIDAVERRCQQMVAKSNVRAAEPAASLGL